MTHTDLEQEILELVKNADFVQECDMWDYVTTEIRDAVRDAEDNVFDRLRESEAETKAEEKAEESGDLDLKALDEKVIKLEEKIDGVLGTIIRLNGFQANMLKSLKKEYTLGEGRDLAAAASPSNETPPHWPLEADDFKEII